MCRLCDSNQGHQITHRIFDFNLLLNIMNKNLGLVWIREDFRTLRNFALSHASKNHKSIVAFYIYKSKKFKDKEAQKWWVYNSIKNFKDDLKKYNINFQIVSSESYKNFFDELVKRRNISLYWNKIYEPDYLKFDDYLRDKLTDSGNEFKIFKGNILNEFHEIKKNDDTPFKVFTPYWRSAEKFYSEKVPIKVNKLNNSKEFLTFFKEINFKDILPKSGWHIKFEDQWVPNEQEGLKKLKVFFNKKLSKYSVDRNIPSLLGTSKLSPYIKHGQLHVETIWEEALKLKDNKRYLQKFIAEIGWREFSHSLINYFPHMLKGNYSKKFDKFPWKKNKKFLDIWKKGLTGYPIVDAGMRELYQTGWMHNRVRMIVGSFLVKHLLIDWKEGEKHFRNCLLDFSEANNISGWQWVSGSGADAAPYFRIFNPILQGEKFDREGIYVKKWVPEIKNLPKKYLHKPWEYKDSKDFIIGKDYPAPIVKHEEARSLALLAFKKL